MLNDTKIYSISQLNTAARLLLEENLPLVWIEGEISNLSTPASGHMYFTLKDEYAQVRCAMFRSQNYKLKTKPKSGMQVLVQAQVSIYAARGDYQLLVYNLEPAGEGVLRQKFEQLKLRLQAEGLFAAEHKKPLPQFPKTIGVITSPTGAAVRDIIHVLQRRFPATKIIIYPTQVQGNDAKEQIAKAINIANKHDQADVLILSRGGGSLEDLWPFNEELVANAIFNSELPIISGVGHEIDYTIADFVADMRAPTPSAAAELATPDCQELLNSLEQFKDKLSQIMQYKLQSCSNVLTNLMQRLQHPGKKLRDYAQHLDIIEQRLQLGMNNILKTKQHFITNLSRALSAVSPLATLSRGYAIVTDNENKVIVNVNDVDVGDDINARLKDGTLVCKITGKKI